MTQLLYLLTPVSEVGREAVGRCPGDAGRGQSTGRSHRRLLHRQQDVLTELGTAQAARLTAEGARVQAGSAAAGDTKQLT